MIYENMGFFFAVLSSGGGTDMFSTGHFVFIVFSLALSAAAILWCRKNRPPLKSVLSVCLAIALVSKITKIFTAMQIVPVVEPAVENGMLIYRT